MEREVSKPHSRPEAMCSYAERSLGLRHGEKTEDELLQRIWNLAGDVTGLVEQLNAVELDRKALAWALWRHHELRYVAPAWGAPCSICDPLYRLALKASSPTSGGQTPAVELGGGVDRPSESLPPESSPASGPPEPSPVKMCGESGDSSPASCPDSSLLNWGAHLIEEQNPATSQNDE